jgi:hypothetical protein
MVGLIAHKPLMRLMFFALIAGGVVTRKCWDSIARVEILRPRWSPDCDPGIGGRPCARCLHSRKSVTC